MLVLIEICKPMLAANTFVKITWLDLIYGQSTKQGGPCFEKRYALRNTAYRTCSSAYLFNLSPLLCKFIFPMKSAQTHTNTEMVKLVTFS